MKRSHKPKPRQRKKPLPLIPALIERKFPHTRFVDFPQMKGKTVEKIEFFTTSEYHSITIDFQDKTALTLTVEPCFLLGSEFSDIKTGNQETIHEWPLIHSAVNRS